MGSGGRTHGALRADSSHRTEALDKRDPCWSHQQLTRTGETSLGSTFFNWKVKALGLHGPEILPGASPTSQSETRALPALPAGPSMWSGAQRRASPRPPVREQLRGRDSQASDPLPAPGLLMYRPVLSESSNE